MSKHATIECMPDGPYRVNDLDDLRNSRGERIETKPAMSLCRCGGSANKPFCDGTHRKNGFSGAKLPGGAADRRESYTAGRITIHDNRSICAHAGRCTEGLAAVFRYKQEPWIDPAGGTLEAIIDTIRTCPSGALSYTLDGVEGFDPMPATTIVVTKDGPYAVTGEVGMPDETRAQGAPATRCTLCRCGGSKNKPFCDGTHWSIGFKDGSP